MRRAARWDGAIPAMAGMAAARPPDVSDVRELVLFLHGCRADYGLADRPFDIVIGGMSPAGPAGGHDLVGPHLSTVSASRAAIEAPVNCRT
jgi:hypothetical protein